MSRRSVALSAGAVLASLILLQGSPATGGEVESLPGVRETGEIDSIVVRGEGATEELDDATLQDLKQAADQGVGSFEDLVASSEDMTDFSIIATGFEEKYSDTYLRAGLGEGEDSASYWVAFVEEPPAAALAELATLSVDVEITFGHPANAVELSRVSGAIAGALADQDETFSSGAVGYDHTTGFIEAEYTLASGRKGDDPDISQSLLRAEAIGASASDDGLLPVAVRFSQVSSPPVQEEVVKGGRMLRFNGNPLCTGGFTAIRNGNRGLLTARHCQNGITYQHLSGVLDNPVIADPVPGGTIDLKWHRTLNPHTTNAEFRASGPSIDRTVTDVANAPEESVVCHWGETTGYSCDTVKSVDICIDYGGGITWCGLDKTYNHISAGGDSGGPWFYGNTARGIHSDGSEDGPNGWSSYTRIGRVEGSLNATVLQG